jgi:type II restriction enzyme
LKGHWRYQDIQFVEGHPRAKELRRFLHPTIVPPFNTVMLNGFNALFSDKKKLGSWQSFLDMREVMVRTNNQLRDSLSKDLGAFAGLLFEIGSGRLLINGNLDAVMQEEKAKAEKAARQRHADVMAEAKEQSEHTQMQALLIKLGRALGYDVHVACNDRGRSYDGPPFALVTLAELPSIG